MCGVARHSGDGKKKREREKSMLFLALLSPGLPFLCPVLVMVSIADLSSFLAMSFGSDVGGCDGFKVRHSEPFEGPDGTPRLKNEANGLRAD